MTDTTRPSDDTARIEGFSDAIFGFAATLLVVSLEVPVLFYVYPLKFIARSFVARFFGAQYAGDMAPITLSDLRQMFAIYGAGWAAVFVFVALLYHHVWRRRDVWGGVSHTYS